MISAQALHLGPLMLPWPLLIALSSLVIALWICGALKAKFQLEAGQWVQFKDSIWTAFLLGLIAARLVFVALNYPFYLESPFEVIKIQDKGFNLIAGAIVAAAWLFWRNRQIPRGFIALFLLILVTVFGTGQLILQKVQAQYQQYPQVNLLDLEQQAVPLQQFIGKPLVVNLWASWCPPCRREMPVLEAAQQRETGVQFVMVNQGEDAVQVQDYLSKNHLVMQNVLLDPAGQTAQATGMYGLPSTLFYNANGQLVESHMGEISQAVLTEKLQKIQ